MKKQIFSQKYIFCEYLIEFKSFVKDCQVGVYPGGMTAQEVSAHGGVSAFGGSAYGDVCLGVYVYPSFPLGRRLPPLGQNS